MMNNISKVTKTLIAGLVGLAASLSVGTAATDLLLQVPRVARPTDQLATTTFLGGLPLSRTDATPDASDLDRFDEASAFAHLLIGPEDTWPSDAAIDPIETGAIVAGVFNSVAIPIRSFPVAKRWARIMSGISECAHDGACGSDSSLLRRIARETEGRTLVEKINIVNSVVNGTLRYRADRSLYGKLDHWATPSEILALASGDCEDFAILKMTALMRTGIPAKSLSVVVLRDNGRGVFHAVLAVTTSSGSFILDNVRAKVARDVDLPNYQPLYSLSEARAWIHGTKSKQNPAMAQSGDFASIAPGEGVTEPGADEGPLARLDLRSSLPALE
jgi:predicted transglutaminase-like cysteine proteinase